MKSLECLTEESINLLESNRLLHPLVKSEFIKNQLTKIEVDEETRNKAVENLKGKLNLTDQETLEQWLKENNFSQKDFEYLAVSDIKLKKAYLRFSRKAEAHFLQRKNELDIVIYSLIRVKDFYTARELYLRISNKESDFGELASKYSEGLEKKSRGIVGPGPLGKIHPQLSALLKQSPPGEIQPPLKIENSYVVVRLESFDSAKLDDFTRGKMEEELFDAWVEKSSLELKNELLAKQFRTVKNTNKNNS